MLSENVPLNSKHTETAPLSSDENIKIRVNLAQIEQLRRLGVLEETQAEAGRRAGRMDVFVPSTLVARFRQENTTHSAEIEKLAQRIFSARLTVPARLFLTAGKPLSFFGSQMLLLAQPASKLLFHKQDPAGQYSRLLEDRANVDRLLHRLDALEADKKAAQTGSGSRAGKPSFKKGKPEEDARQSKSYNESSRL